MKNNKIAELVAVALFTMIGAVPSAFAQAEKIGNGGKGVLCGSKLRVLDIYESEEVYHRKTSTKHQTLEENLKDYGFKAYQYLYGPYAIKDPAEMMEGYRTSLLDLFRDIPEGQTLPTS